MSLKDKNILVTGSDGFIGRYLVRELKKIGARVLTFDKTEGKDIIRWKDFRDIPKVDLVYHLAAITFIPFSQMNPRITYEVNVGGTINVLEFCRLNNSKIIFASSCIYGRPKYIPIDEKHPVCPINPYSRSKVLGEMLCRAYNEDYGIKCVVIRPFNIYGKGQKEIFLIPHIINQIKTKKVITLKVLRPKRDFLYITDLIRAYIKAGEYNKSSFEIFNIGFGKSYSVREIAKRLIKLSNKDHTKVKSNRKKRQGEVLDTISDIRKARKILKWRPLVDIDEGLRNILKN